MCRIRIRKVPKLLACVDPETGKIRKSFEILAAAQLCTCNSNSVVDPVDFDPLNPDPDPGEQK